MYIYLDESEDTVLLETNSQRSNKINSEYS